MAIIQTVKGEIPAEELGVTYGHEHLFFIPPKPYSEKDPDLCLDSVETAIREVNTFKLAGGSSIVEMSTVEMGRSPDGLREISETTGVHVIAATGFNKAIFSKEYIREKTVQELADAMVRDLLEGMDGSEIKAGVIKVSTSKDQIQPSEEKALQAAVIAYRETGAPISTHTEAGTFAMEQADRLTGSGVSPENILIGHLDRKLDWEYLKQIAETGVFMGFDQLSKEKYYPDIERIEMIKRLIDTGHGHQILLSGDLARKSYWPSYGFGYGPGLTYILWRFVPWMLDAGISKEAVQNILVHNPARAFSWR